MPLRPTQNRATLPTIAGVTNFEELVSYLKLWEMSTRRILKKAIPLKVPRNIVATDQRGGILLEWARVADADGYEILWTTDGDFSKNVQSVLLRSGQATNYFDVTGGSGTPVNITRYYKIRATSGTFSEPQSVKGTLSGVVSNTSIDPDDTTTVPDPSEPYDPGPGGGGEGGGELIL